MSGLFFHGIYNVIQDSALQNPLRVNVYTFVCAVCVYKFL